MEKLPLDDRLVDFSVSILGLVPRLGGSYPSRHISRQLIRSATSIGANYEEASGAESEQDFIHKMQVALKEARESCYWLRLLLRSRPDHSSTVQPLYSECEQIKAMLIASVMRMKAKALKESGQF